MGSVDIIEKLNDKKYKKLSKKIKSLGYSEQNIPTILYHIDKLSNIIIDSYIKSKEKENEECNNLL